MKITIASCLVAAFSFIGMGATNVIVDVNWRDNPEMLARVKSAREKYKGMTPEQMKEIRTGGLVVRAGSGEGKVTFVNAQKELPRGALEDLVRKMSFLFQFRMEVVDGTSPTLETADNLAKATAGTAVVFITDDKRLPKSLVSYEENWGIANVGKLENAMPAIRNERMKRLIFRTFALVAGLADAQQIGSTMWPAKSDADLDSVWLPTMPVPNLLTPISKHLQRLGMKPITVMTYRRACQEGWAPQPTNDIQKAIWDKVHSPPEKPIKITYDKDKQKPVVK